VKRVWLALCLLALAWPAHAASFGDADTAPPAQAAPIRITRNDAESALPDAVNFHLEASGDARITQAQIEYGADALTCAGPAAVTATPEFTAGDDVSVDYTWELKKTGTLPPGAHVWWRWRLSDDAGHTFVTDVQQLTAADTRYTWRTATRGPLTLHWYSGSQSFADALLDSGIAGLARLEQDTGVVVSDTIDLYIYDSAGALSGIILYAPSWAGGVAYPEHNVVLIGIAPDNLDWGKPTVKHELTHVVIGHLTLNCLSDLPTWLNEGLAVYAEGPLDADSQAQLDRAVRGNRLDSVRALGAAFSAHPERATLAYAESFSLVDFLIARQGKANVLALLHAFASGDNTDAALRAVYGFDSDGLDAAWRAAIGAPPRPAASPTPAGGATAVPTLPPIGAPPQAPTAAGSAQPAATALPATRTPRPTSTAVPVKTSAPVLPTVALTPIPLPEPAGPPLVLVLAAACVLGLGLLGAAFLFARRAAGP
jgi:hypothetical protein